MSNFCFIVKLLTTYQNVLLQQFRTFNMVLHTKSADFLKQATLRVQNLITEGYIKILKSGISRENDQLSFDILII